MRKIITWTLVAFGFAIIGSLAVGGGNSKVVYYEYTDTLRGPDADTLTTDDADSTFINIPYDLEGNYLCNAVLKIDSLAGDSLTNCFVQLQGNIASSIEEGYWVADYDEFLTGYTAAPDYFLERNSIYGIHNRILFAMPDSGSYVCYHLFMTFTPY